MNYRKKIFYRIDAKLQQPSGFEGSSSDERISAPSFEVPSTDERTCAIFVEEFTAVAAPTLAMAFFIQNLQHG